jgi:hypothetical protein
MARLLTVAQAVSDASMEIGITQVPVTIVIGSGDQDVAQMGALLSTVAGELLLDPPYRDELGDGNWLCSNDGSIFKDRPSSDDDLILFDPRLVVDGLKYRFLKAKSLEYGEEQRDFITRQNKLAARLAPIIDLNSDVGRQQ